MSANLKRQVLAGIMWNTVARIGQQSVQFALSVILARLLLPDDFGTMGMILVFTSFIGMFAEAGFGSAVVQRTHVSDRHLQSVFWFNVASGLFLFAVMFASAPLLVGFYREPALLSLTRGLSPVFVLISVGLVPAALMQRRLQFHILARISLVATLASGVIAVAMAVLGAGIWSLAAQYLVRHLVVTLLNLAFSGWRPRRTFSLDALKELWGFTGNLLGFNFVNYWARNADNMLIGRFLGAAALGYYSRAYGLMLMPITQIISVISNVMFAALSTIKGDQARVRNIFLRAIGLTTLLVFPLMTGLFIVAQPFVLVFFGEKWADMIPTLRILALVGAVQSLVNPTGWLYLSQGRTDRLLHWGVARTVVLVAAIAIGLVLGSIEAVALCYAIANLLLLYPDIAIPGRFVGMSFRDVFSTVAGPLAGSAIMGFAVFGLGLLLADVMSDWLELIALSAAGVLVYGAFAVGLRLPAWLEVVALIRERFPWSANPGALPTSSE
jgi:O-antigen/teichoic acid export membrane protein